MDITDYLAVFRKHWLLIVSFALLGVLLAATISFITPPRYTAKTSVFFSVQAATSGSDLAQGSTYAEKQVQSYAEVATSPVVLQPVIDEMRLPTTVAGLARQMTVTVPQKTVIIELSVLDGDPQKAAEIANAVSRQLSTAVVSLTPKTPQGTEAVRATVISPAATPTAPTTPKIPQNLALGLLLGLAIGCGLALLRHALDTNIRQQDDIARVTERSVIGTIPFDDSVPDDALAGTTQQHTPLAEAYRRLRTNVQFLDVDDRPSSIVITSSIPGEGKSTTAINLATTLSDAGRSVLLIEGDLRRPRMADYIGVEGTVGLTTVLIGQAELQDVVQTISPSDLHVLPSGQIPPNPSELLGSERMESLLKQATDTYDIVIVDAPPLLPVTDGAILARKTGGALVVVGSERVRQPQLRESLSTLEDVDAHVFGMVLNMVKIDRSSRYSYRYNYKYSGYAPKSPTRSVTSPSEDEVDSAEKEKEGALPGA